MSKRRARHSEITRVDEVMENLVAYTVCFQIKYENAGGNIWGRGGTGGVQERGLRRFNELTVQSKELVSMRDAKNIPKNTSAC